MLVKEIISRGVQIGTTTHALCFGGSNTFLQGYVDSDIVGDKDNKRSTTGYVFTIGGTTVSWI
jgi:hypothetical protein